MMNSRNAWTPDFKEISEQDIESIAATVRHYHGFDFRNYAPSSLRRRIARIVSIYRLKSVAQLLERLQKDKPFYDEFLHEITVNTTELFRDPAFWRSMRTLLQAQMSGKRHIYIWHAGVSTGEELYSMLIILHELGFLEKARLLGTDISDKVLEQAQQGLLHERNLELYKKNHQEAGGTQNLSDYFQQGKDGHYYLHEELIGPGVKFKRHDLVQDAAPSRYDLIMCRNVLIYFDATLQDKVIQKFYSAMFNGSYLAIGSKESLVMSSMASKYVTIDKEHKIFQLRKT